MFCFYSVCDIAGSIRLCHSRTQHIDGDRPVTSLNSLLPTAAYNSNVMTSLSTGAWFRKTTVFVIVNIPNCSAVYIVIVKGCKYAVMFLLVGVNGVT